MMMQEKQRPEVSGLTPLQPPVPVCIHMLCLTWLLSSCGVLSSSQQPQAVQQQDLQDDFPVLYQDEQMFSQLVPVTGCWI